MVGAKPAYPETARAAVLKAVFEEGLSARKAAQRLRAGQLEGCGAVPAPDGRVQEWARLERRRRMAQTSPNPETYENLCTRLYRLVDQSIAQAEHEAKKGKSLELKRLRDLTALAREARALLPDRNPEPDSGEDPEAKATPTPPSFLEKIAKDRTAATKPPESEALEREGNQQLPEPQPATNGKGEATEFGGVLTATSAQPAIASSP